MIPPCLGLDMGSFDKKEGKQHWELHFNQGHFRYFKLGPFGGTISISLCEDQAIILFFFFFFHGTNTVVIQVTST